jgi:hypothetical protein
MDKKENILQEADRLTSDDRRKEYGSPREFYKKTAAMWSVILDTPVAPEQVGLCMIAFKMVREMHAHKRDSLVDIAGYARTLEINYDELTAFLEEVQV